MNYPKEAIQQLTSLIGGNDEGRAWLQKNNFPELILFHYAVDGNEQALLELTKKKYVDLIAFVHAIQDDKLAFNWLAKNKKIVMAATTRVTYNDKDAEAWLMRHNLPHYVELGRSIKKNEANEAADDVFGLMKKFINWFRKNPLKR